MSDDPLSGLLDRSVAHLPDSEPPLADLLRRGHAARRRRLRSAVAGIAVATVVVVGTFATVQHATRPPTGGDPAPLTAAPTGMRWVGVGGTVVAVPSQWPIVPGVYCPGPAPYYVTLTRWHVVAGCRPVSEPDPTRMAVDIEAGPWGGIVARLTGSGALTQQALAASRTTLPRGWLAVPTGEPAGGVGPPTLTSEVEALRAAGFRVLRRTAAADALGQAVTTNPAIGTPARRGSLITVYDHGVTASSATLSGRLLWVGGPAPGLPVAHAGTVRVVSADDSVDQTVAAGDDGRWSILVPPGTYRVRATSPGYLSAIGESDACAADHDVIVGDHGSASVTVICQLR